MSDSFVVPVDAAASRRVARNAAALAIASIASKGALFLWQLVLARLLSQSALGSYFTILGMLAIAATIPEFGMGLIVLRDVAQKRALAGKMLTVTLVVQLLLASVAYGGLILAGLLLGYDEVIHSLLPLAGLSLFIDLLGNMVYNQLLAREQMIVPAVVSVVHVFVQIGLVGLALLGGLGLVGLYGATVAASALRALIFWITLTRVGVRTVWPLDRTVMWGLLANGLPLAINSLLGMAYQHIDKIITTAVIGEENTALLGAAFILVVGMVELLSTTVLVAVFPMMSRQYGDGQRDAFDFLVEKIAFLTLVISVPIGVGVSVLASPIVALLFPADYIATTDVLAILIWFGVITMASAVFAQVLMIQNRQTRLLVIRAGGLMFNVLLVIVLLPRLGTPGAAVSSVTAEIVILTFLLRQWDVDGQHWRRLRPRLLRLAVAGLVMALVMLLLRAAGTSSSETVQQVLLLTAPVAGGLAYLVLVGLLGVIAPDDRGFIRQVLVSMPGGSLVARLWPAA